MRTPRPARRPAPTLNDAPRVGVVTGVGWAPGWCGVCESVYQIATSVDAVVVVTTGEGGVTQTLRDAGMPVVTIGLEVSSFRRLRAMSLRRKATFAVSLLVYVARVVAVLRRSRVQVVYLSDHIPLLAVPALRFAGFPIVTTVRGLVPPRRHWVLALRLANRVVCLSREMRDAVACLPGASERFRSRLVIIANGVRAQSAMLSARVMRERAGLPVDASLVLLVGTIEPRKAQVAFVRDVVPHILRASPSQVHVVIVGEPRTHTDHEYARLLAEAAADPTVEGRVHLVGFSEHVADWYAAADVVALASRSEGQPRTLLEALVHGVPFVSTDVQSARELADSGGGVVVPQDAPEAFAGALRVYLDDRDAREVAGARGREFAQRSLSSEGSVAAYRRLFSEVVRQHGAGS